MTESAVVHTQAADARAAARELAAKIAKAMPDGPPDALILFASPRYDQDALLGAIQERVRPGALVGASSSGEFTHQARGQGLACALALRSSEMKFSAGLGRGLRLDRTAAARELVASFTGVNDGGHPYRAALVMTDALAGHADCLVDELTLVTSGKYRFFGGGAGDDGQFRHTRVFCGTEAVTDAVAGLEILSTRPIGVGVGHGWQPVGEGMRVTESDGMRLVSLNGFPAARAFEQHARSTGQVVDWTVPSFFLLNNVLGIATPAGDRLRVPLALQEDGSVLCCADVPEGAVVHIMKTTETSAVEAATRAAREAVNQLAGTRPQVALFFDCVATRLRIGEIFHYELRSVEKALWPASLVGCNTHGQIARAEGQFSGFHNCTAVVCVLPA